MMRICRYRPARPSRRVSEIKSLKAAPEALPAATNLDSSGSSESVPREKVSPRDTPGALFDANQVLAPPKQHQRSRAAECEQDRSRFRNLTGCDFLCRI